MNHAERDSLALPVDFCESGRKGDASGKKLELEEVKSRIRKLTARLAVESSTRVQAELRSRVEGLRKECRSAHAVDTSEVDINACALEVRSPRLFTGGAGKVVWRRLHGETVVGQECAEAVIEECEHLHVENLACAHSLLIVNVRSSEINATAGQVRLVNCMDVVLHVDAKTGVFLQESTRISIGGLAGNAPRVRDFSCPFGSTNYTLLS